MNPQQLQKFETVRVGDHVVKCHFVVHKNERKKTSQTSTTQKIHMFFTKKSINIAKIKRRRIRRVEDAPKRREKWSQKGVLLLQERRKIEKLVDISKLANC